MVEVGISAIKKRGNAPGFDVANDFPVFFAVDFEVGIACQRRNGDDGGIELLGSDW